MIEKERGKLRNSEPAAKAWAERIAECDRMRAEYQKQQAKGLMTLDELSTQLSDLERDKAEAEQSLKDAQGRSERLAELERDRADLQRLYRERALERGLASFTAEQRREIYKRLKLVVHIHADQSVGVQGDLPLTIDYFNSPWTVTDMEVDSHGYSATLVFNGKSDTFVCENEKWASVHSQSNSQDSSRFNDTS
jgi:chromosome segregation ATPase